MICINIDVWNNLSELTEVSNLLESCFSSECFPYQKQSITLSLARRWDIIISRAGKHPVEPRKCPFMDLLPNSLVFNSYFRPTYCRSTM